MTAAVAPSPQQFLLDYADWDFYESLLEQLDNRPVFVTYDRGRLELMSPSYEHDKSGEMLALFIRTVAQALKMPICGAGSTTFRRKDLDRGLEPDRCFFIKSEPRIRGKRKLDLRRDPPPDLVIEVEISQRLLDRVGIYAAMGVQELWRFDGKRLSVHLLQRDKTYKSVERSPTFPSLPLRQVDLFIKRGFEIDETTWAHEVNQWARRNLRSR